jgi:hypothetical protein
MSSLRRSAVAPISTRTSPQRGGRLYLDLQRLDTSAPPGKAMVQMVGIFAEFERALIAERVRAKPLGANLGRLKVDEAVEPPLKGTPRQRGRRGIGAATREAEFNDKEHQTGKTTMNERAPSACSARPWSRLTRRPVRS